MDKREEIVALCGQIVNGMLSSDSSFFERLFDRNCYGKVASHCVNLAIKIQENIDKQIEKT